MVPAIDVKDCKKTATWNIHILWNCLPNCQAQTTIWADFCGKIQILYALQSNLQFREENETCIIAALNTDACFCYAINYYLGNIANNLWHNNKHLDFDTICINSESTFIASTVWRIRHNICGM